MPEDTVIIVENDNTVVLESNIIETVEIVNENEIILHSNIVSDIYVKEIEKEIVVVSAGVKGDKGDKGDIGPSGSMAGIIKAATAISAYKMITVDSNGEAILASNDNAGHANRILGFSINSSNTGEDVEYIIEGSKEELLWNYNTGDILYLGVAGAITNTLPLAVNGAAFQSIVGFVLNPKRIKIQIQNSLNII